MDILQQYGNGMKMEDIEYSSQNVMNWIEGFVDDTSLCTNTSEDSLNSRENARRW
jgi:hypothetical protein